MTAAAVTSLPSASRAVAYPSDWLDRADLGPLPDLRAVLLGPLEQRGVELVAHHHGEQRLAVRAGELLPAAQRDRGRGGSRPAQARRSGRPRRPATRRSGRRRTSCTAGARPAQARSSAPRAAAAALAAASPAGPAPMTATSHSARSCTQAA